MDQIDMEKILGTKLKLCYVFMDAKYSLAKNLITEFFLFSFFLV
jgi:hypothetical protein